MARPRRVGSCSLVEAVIRERTKVTLLRSR